MAFGISKVKAEVEKLVGEVEAGSQIVAGLGHDMVDVRKFMDTLTQLFTDFKVGQAEIKTMLGHASVAAGSVIVAAPPPGAVLVAVPAEHVAALPDALAAIVANVGAGIQNVIPK